MQPAMHNMSLLLRMEIRKSEILAEKPRIYRNPLNTLNHLLFPGFKYFLCISEAFEAFYGVLLKPAMHNMSLLLRMEIRKSEILAGKAPNLP